MKTFDHLQAHQDHRLWDSDVKMWTHDIKMWQEEIVSLSEALSFINEAVTNHEEALKSHYESIMKHHERLSQHEVDIKYVREGTPLDSEMLGVHQEEESIHTVQFKAHERLKRYHHAIMTLTKSLKQALESVA